MIKLIDLENAHAGRPAAVLGGGTSLAADLQLMPPDSVLIAANHHASCIGIDPDYIVFMDKPLHFPNLWQVLKDYSGTKVTHDLRYTDVSMAGVDYWNGPNTGLVATWLACFMGCDPVVLCGMDLYQNEKKYCHPGEPDKAIYRIPLDEHLKRWKAGFRRCPGIERVRAVSGPLVDVFGEYSPISVRVPRSGV